ncbi:DUF6234 family protein [Streptomyces aurantiogriseus]|uniref:DUF6234 domain-containing protein n=1 Tax=Streptomyces aurantiogriseus TaxID=66870 RepID=A0A918FMG4_9ACTN|nr:DUF6234 family protein [Streptomyces aurantiogriseus]GGR55793.1 hypothetical protein GCM10010251_85850 [Streptomyces aurantiogriseus]
MTTASTFAAPRPSTRLHPVADVFLALVLLAADAVAALIACLWGLDAAGFEFFGSDGNSTVSFTTAGVYLSVVGLLVLATAFLAGRGRAYVTAVLQAAAGAVLLLTAGFGLSEQYREDHPPVPEPGYSGPQSQCLSGGDTSECNGS